MFCCASADALKGKSANGPFSIVVHDGEVYSTLNYAYALREELYTCYGPSCRPLLSRTLPGRLSQLRWDGVVSVRLVREHNMGAEVHCCMGHIPLPARESLLRRFSAASCE